MPSWVVGADHALFHRINAVWTCGFLDSLMPLLTRLPAVWIIRWGMIPGGLAFWLHRGRARAAKVIVVLGLVIGSTDLLAYRAIKPLVRRARPEYAGVAAVLREGAHGRYGFPSNHAANMFAGASFLGRVYPGARAPLFVAAAIVGYSRVYVGAHFPADVAGGALLGLLVGWLAWRISARHLDKREGERL